MTAVSDFQVKHEEEDGIITKTHKWVNYRMDSENVKINTKKKKSYWKRNGASEKIILSKFKLK